MMTMLLTNNGARISAVTRAMMITTTLTANGKILSRPTRGQLEIFFRTGIFKKPFFPQGITPEKFGIAGAARGSELLNKMDSSHPFDLTLTHPYAII